MLDTVLGDITLALLGLALLAFLVSCVRAILKS
jgi:hypothetical protein